MDIQVNGNELTIDATATAADLFKQLHPDIDPSAAGYWILAREDGTKYIENPQRKDQRITYLFDDGDPVPIYLEQPDKCSHGSPAVRNKGFLCGWC